MRALDELSDLSRPEKLQDGPELIRRGDGRCLDDINLERGGRRLAEDAASGGLLGRGAEEV